MKYLVYAVNPKTKEMTKKYELDSQEKAEQKVERMKTKINKIIAFPDLKVGTVLYQKGEIYATIVNETESLWGMKKPTYKEEILTYFLKENMLGYFIKGNFDPIEEYVEIKEEDKKE